jgi:DNA-binding transcriptional MerR regulator
MLKIGEFSVLSNISIYMLRNYDKIGLLTQTALISKTVIGTIVWTN